MACMMGLRAPAAARPAMMVAVAPVPRRSLVVVAAAGDAAEKKKRLPQPVKRAQQAVERRMVNKSRKSATATRIKKAIKAAEALIKTPDAAAIPALEQLVSEAYKQIDMAAIKGAMHANTAARRKARVAAYKRKAAIAAGLYVPAGPEVPGWAFYQRMQAAAAKQ